MPRITKASELPALPLLIHSPGLAIVSPQKTEVNNILLFCNANLLNNNRL
jgi:hypothetical protein